MVLRKPKSEMFYMLHEKMDLIKIPNKKSVFTCQTPDHDTTLYLELRNYCILIYITLSRVMATM